MGLLVVPLGCASGVLLYMKPGGRYDPGAILYVAAGAYAVPLASRASLPGVLEVFCAVLAAALISLPLRWLALAADAPMAFTVVSIGQMWATAPLINHVTTRFEYSGLYVGQVASGYLVGIAASIVCLASSAFVVRLRLHVKLRAATDSPFEYEALIGPRAALAAGVEATVVTGYVAAGLCLALVSNDLSASRFSHEWLWIMISVSAFPRFGVFAAFVGPLATSVVRQGVVLVAPSHSSLVAVGLLAVALLLSGVAASSLTRVRRA